MNETPILMCGEMVRATLADRKTETRRVGKCQSSYATELGVDYIKHATKGEVAIATYRAHPGGGTARWGLCECPYGIPGDRLWVRESWATKREWNERSPSALPVIHEWKTAEHPCIAYLASGKPDHIEHSPVGRGRPSIHMPRWASRITLEITGIRAERVQDITAAGAIAEGIGVDDAQMRETPNFRELWDSLNARRDKGIYAWTNNPWVWVIQFKRVPSVPSVKSVVKPLFP
jgi:hypothetical protein